MFFDKGDEVLALPSWAAPRILIVSRSLRQRWRDSAAFYPAFRFRARLVKLVVRTAAAFFPRLFLRQSRKDAGGTKYRLAKFLNHTFPSFKQSAIAYSLFSDYFISTGILAADEYVDCADRRGQLTDLLRNWFPQTDRVVLVAGAASDPKQKLVAKLVDQGGKMVGFVKFGEKPLARQRIETEAEILQSLPAGCGPCFQGVEKSEPYSCFAMSAVDGKMPEAKLPASVDSYQLSAVREYLERLRISDVTFGVDDHPAIMRIRKEVAGGGWQVASDPRQPSTINEQLDSLLEPLREQRWPLVIQHGDFTPWNVLRISEGRRLKVEDGSLSSVVSHQSSELCAIDWEEGTTEGFPHFDFIYYILQTAYFMHHWSAAQASAYARDVLSSQLSVDRDCPTTTNYQPSTEPFSVPSHPSSVISSLIKLAALDAWLAGERGGLSGKPLQQFRLSIVNFSAAGGSARGRKT